MFNDEVMGVIARTAQKKNPERHMLDDDETTAIIRRRNKPYEREAGTRFKDNASSSCMDLKIQSGVGAEIKFKKKPTDEVKPKKNPVNLGPPPSPAAHQYNPKFWERRR